MEHACLSALLFIALLHLCHAQVSRTWYAANVINDGDFSPKPISEIFSTPQPPFSSTNPIVVLGGSSTPSPPISTSFPPTFSTFPSLSTDNPVSQNLLSTLESQSTFRPPVTSGPPFGLNQLPGLQPDKLNSPPNYFVIYQPGQPLQTLPQPAPQQGFSTLPPPTSFESSTLSTGDFSSPQSTFRPDLSSSTFSTFQPDISSRPSTFSTLPPVLTQSTFSTFRPPSLPTFSTPRPEISTPQTTWTTPAPIRSTVPTTLITGRPLNTPASSLGTFRPSSSSTLAPQLSTKPCDANSSGNNNSPPRYPTLRIRMVAPSGSITNINVNPTVRTTTTKRPPTKRSTTTRKPTTTRTRRTKKTKNTYDGCMNMCSGKKPICAVPLASVTLDADKMKGFPSVCHMACHNSFKKDQYEMLIEGRCGKFRTRIRTVDTNKMKRVELDKTQYTVIGDDPQTIVELSSLPRK